MPQSVTRRTCTPSQLAISRFSAGLTQEELAERVGISRVSISNLERGQHQPRRITALALAEALGCTLTELFPPDDERPPAEVGVVQESRRQAGHDGE